MSTTKENLARQIYFARGQHDCSATWRKGDESVTVSNRRENGLNVLLVTFKCGGYVLSSMERGLYDAAGDVEKWVDAGCTFPY